MKRETLTALSLASLAFFSIGSPVWAQQSPPPAQYPPGYPPPAQYPPPGYPPPQQPRPAPPPGYPQQPQQPVPAQPPGYPPQPAYPPGYPQPQAPPQQPAPQYPPQYPPQPAPQYPPPGYPPQQPAPQYPPPGYPPQQPGYPQPGYPQQPGYPPQAGYPPPPYDAYATGVKPPNQHLGFMIRLAAGPNYTTTGWAQNSEKLGSTGFGGFFDFAVGAAMMENLCLYGEFTAYSMLSGNYKGKVILNGVSVSGDEDTEDKYYLLGIGPGASYYIMPLNLYVGGSLQLAFLRGKAVKYTDDPDIGFAVNGDVGKEFFVTDDWGVGINSRISVARHGVKSGIVELTHTTWTFGVGFVATFN